MRDAPPALPGRRHRPPRAGVPIPDRPNPTAVSRASGRGYRRRPFKKVSAGSCKERVRWPTEWVPASWFAQAAGAGLKTARPRPTSPTEYRRKVPRPWRWRHARRRDDERLPTGNPTGKTRPLPNPAPPDPSGPATTTDDRARQGNSWGVPVPDFTQQHQVRIEPEQLLPAFPGRLDRVGPEPGGRLTDPLPPFQSQQPRAAPDQIVSGKRPGRWFVRNFGRCPRLEHRGKAASFDPFPH